MARDDLGRWLAGTSGNAGRADLKCAAEPSSRFA